MSNGKGPTTTSVEPPPPTPIFIGIDLGAERSRVAAVVDGTIRILPNHDEKRYITSTLSVKAGRRVIGAGSLNAAPTNFIRDACQDHRLGVAHPNHLSNNDSLSWSSNINSQGVYLLQTEPIQQQVVIATVLDHLKDLAEKALKGSGGGGEVKGAVIVIPTYSSNNFRIVVQQAATIAGFEYIRLLNQSTAASITYRRNNRNHAQPHLLGIVCMGASSLEVSLFDGRMRLISSKGCTNFGGNAFTRCILEGALDLIREQTAADRTFTKSYIKKVWEDCEKAKIDLSSADSTHLKIQPFDEEYEIERFTRHALHGLCKEHFTRFDAIVGEVFSPCKESISEVLFVGGATRVPRLREIVKQYTSPKCICETSIMPEEVVVFGAATQAAFASGDHSDMYANVDDYAYAPTMGYCNGILSCLIQPGEVAGSPQFKEPAITTHMPIGLQVLKNEGDELVSEVRVLAPAKLYFSLNESGCVSIRGIPEGSFQWSIPDENLMTPEQVAAAKKNHLSQREEKRKKEQRAEELKKEQQRAALKRQQEAEAALKRQQEEAEAKAALQRQKEEEEKAALKRQQEAESLREQELQRQKAAEALQRQQGAKTIRKKEVQRILMGKQNEAETLLARKAKSARTREPHPSATAKQKGNGNAQPERDQDYMDMDDVVMVKKEEEELEGMDVRDLKLEEAIEVQAEVVLDEKPISTARLRNTARRAISPITKREAPPNSPMPIQEYTERISMLEIKVLLAKNLRKTDMDRFRLLCVEVKASDISPFKFQHLQRCFYNLILLDNILERANKIRDAIKAKTTVLWFFLIMMKIGAARYKLDQEAHVEIENKAMEGVCTRLHMLYDNFAKEIVDILKSQKHILATDRNFMRLLRERISDGSE